MLLLGIETSCDETAAAIVRDDRAVLSSIVASQVDIHAQWGGIVPEAAARMHVERVNPVIQQALDTAGIGFDGIDAVAVTHRPGLVGALVVGMAAAKAISFARKIPLVGVNHLAGHFYSPFLSAEPRFPCIALIVSGGHTELVYSKAPEKFQLIGQTLDDAAGEAFDKTARLLGLGYPGGAALSELAKQGDSTQIKLPRAKLSTPFDFSFSGLKTAVLRYVQSAPKGFSKPDLCAALEMAIAEPLVSRTMAGAETYGVGTVTVSGGVSANRTLRSLMASACEQNGFELLMPEPHYCTDNAAMIALAGWYRLQTHGPDDFDLDAYAYGDWSS
ncbi:MAG: tRNA (adenosine(37)-N6)-threonylcarbamoyltransferase complex transferase subunit TsaD [Armatimonadetes bacterium]|nr:tRNA (adenosine(37)-N6)-threonylcarbamoyltransferase complex transferase subunit TsaD [Armatimonadota bacterium]